MKKFITKVNNNFIKNLIPSFLELNFKNLKTFSTAMFQKNPLFIKYFNFINILLLPNSSNKIIN